MKIKTCGLFRQEDITFANILQPDFIGFVFAPSKREIHISQAYEYKKHLVDSIQVVGVFVDSPKERILEIIQAGLIDIIQLHGNESEEYIAELKALCNAPIIKAVRVQNIHDIHTTTLADYMLYDSGSGGSGLCFDWRFLDEIHNTKPYFLAGGINANNLAQAISHKPYAIDVSSGIESQGIKDFEKMAHIIHTIRGNAHE